MQLHDFILFLTRAFFLLAGVISIINFIRYRNRVRADIALVFGSWSLIVLIGTFNSIFPGLLPGWSSYVALLLTVGLAYTTLRLVRHFRPVPTWFMRFAFIGMLLAWIPLILLRPPYSPLMIIPIAAYFLVVAGYAVVAFIRGAVTTSGVTHGRLVMIAAATAMLVGNILLAAVDNLIPNIHESLTPLSSVFGLTGVIAYYLGAAPPRPLRQYWQLREIHQFLKEVRRSTPGHETPAEHLARLARYAVSTVGGMEAVTLLWSNTKRRFIPDSPVKIEEASPMGQLWANSRSGYIYLTSEMRQANPALGEYDAVLFVPISQPTEPLGLLMVMLRYGSLFPENDLELLELLAEQSAADIQYARLVNEQRELIAQLGDANKELEGFSYTVSHDLRAPLRAIDGFAQILVRADGANLSAKGKESLNYVLTNARQMSRLIDDLLRFSRLGRQAVSREDVNMTELAETVVEEAVHDVQGRVIHTKVGSLPTAQAHEGLIKQVLINLVENAIKFTRMREVAEIEIGMQDSRTYFVRDNGIGFDMKYAEDIFGVFERLELAEDYEGTGIGLAIVRQIIRKHGGDIWVESQPNHGATFYFTLGGNGDRDGK